jgi:hypothetical protein
LRRSWGSKQIDETQWQYDIATARQTGAQHAPLYFLSAFLFSRDAFKHVIRANISVFTKHGPEARTCTHDEIFVVTQSR